MKTVPSLEEINITLDKISRFQSESAVAWEKRFAEIEEQREKQRIEAEKRNEKQRVEYEARRAESEKRNEEQREKQRIEYEARRVEAEKTMEDLKQTVKEIGRQLGGIGNANGKAVEELFFNTLQKKMEFGGIKFDEIEPNLGRKFTKQGIENEIDIVMYNGRTIALIETKFTARKEHITNLIEKKLKFFREYFPQYSGYEIVLGIAALSFEDKEVINTAKELGIGILKAVGDTVEIDANDIKFY